MNWKTVRLTREQYAAVERFGSAHLGTRTATEAVRMILAILLEDHGIPFPNQTPQWGGRRPRAGRKPKAR